MGKLVLAKQPELRAPYMVAGFAGWPNGGGVSTDVVDFLRSYLAAEEIGEITPDCTSIRLRRWRVVQLSPFSRAW